MKGREFLRGFFPLFFTFGIAQLTLQIDLVMLSRLGETSTIAYIALMRIAVLDAIIMMATGAVTSVFVSRGRRDGNVEIVVPQMIVISVLIGVVTAVAGLLFYPHLAALLLDNRELSGLASDAVFWFSISAPFRMIACSATFILIALDHGGLVIVWKCIECLLKILLNYVLIFFWARGFNGCYIAGVIVMLLTSLGSLIVIRTELNFRLCWPKRAWLRDFVCNIGWEVQRLLSAQIYGLLTLVLFSSSYIVPMKMERLSAVSMGTALMLLLSAPLMALMRSFSQQLAGCSMLVMISTFNLLCRTGLPPVLGVTAALLLRGDWLVKTLYGQLHGRWWSVLLLMLSLSLPLRYFNQLQRGLLLARMQFNLVARVDTRIIWLFNFPVIVAGLYFDNPFIAFSQIFVGELLAMVWMGRGYLLPFYRISAIGRPRIKKTRRMVSGTGLSPHLAMAVRYSIPLYTLLLPDEAL
ncbi:MATE family efflux transporter [Candidatus Methylospira mobilis]|uniref:MATE family efflux transporter n=1 Tax=Candidatus Methylospira mobilis TaxID=1808979 RepID=UPI0028E76430|nr:MATE family efflux transporter [Candidatus Methylospira mobilis]WNV03787.1 MATE family efflux transporter [Candidatus Methylospira mobilis]